MDKSDFPIAQLSFAQKLDLMEMLWVDLIDNEKMLESPSWHEAVLNDREAALNADKISISSWEAAKERIKNNVS